MPIMSWLWGQRGQRYWLNGTSTLKQKMHKILINKINYINITCQQESVTTTNYNVSFCLHKLALKCVFVLLSLLICYLLSNRPHFTLGVKADLHYGYGLPNPNKICHQTYEMSGNLKLLRCWKNNNN